MNRSRLTATILAGIAFGLSAAAAVAGPLMDRIKAGRFDIITGGMNILKSRCGNIAFSEPMAKIGDAFIVAKGNPEGPSNYADLKDKGAVMVTGAGYSNIEAARAAGVDEANIMQVPGPAEILAAVRPAVRMPGRAPTLP